MIEALNDPILYQMKSSHIKVKGAESDFQRYTGLDPASMDKDRLMDVCRDFESLFIKQMLDSMRKTVNKSGLIERGMGEDIFEDMLYDEYAKKIANTANLGISRLLYNQLSKAK